MTPAELAKELSRRRSGFWSFMSPEDLARWALSDQPEEAPFTDLPEAADDLPAFQRSLGNLDHAKPRDLALATMGRIIRWLIPAAARTGGRHWLVSPYTGNGWHRLRLTVGMCWAAQMTWDDGSPPDATLRTASTPIDEALQEGSLSADELDEYGIVRRRDSLATFAEDAAAFDCPNLEALDWFLDQPPVVRAYRLMNARLVSTGNFAFQNSYKPELVAAAWAASEAFDVDPAPARPYSGRPGDGDFPQWQATNPEAHEQARDEHDRLVRMLIGQLEAAGLAWEEPPSPRADLAWHLPDGTYVVAEVKSSPGPSESDRLRLGLGQVLDYRHRASLEHHRVAAALVVSRVEDRRWFDVCESAGVHLLTAEEPAAWSRIILAHGAQAVR